MKTVMPFVFRRHLNRWEWDFLQPDGSWGDETTAQRFDRRDEMYEFARSVLGDEGWKPSNLNAVRMQSHLAYILYGL
jgi:hypothetical protein